MKIIRVLAVGDPAVDVYTSPKYEILPRFEEAEGIKVDFHIVPWDSYYATLMDAFSGAKQFDIVMVAGHLWLRDFVEKGYLAEINEPDSIEYHPEDVLPVVDGEMKLSGTRYLYPSFCDGHIILYRKSAVLERVGKLLPEAITTDEYMEIVAKCHGCNGMAGAAMKAHESEIFLDFLPYLRAEGIDAFLDGVPAFNGPEGVRALEKYISLKEYAISGTENFGNAEVSRAFREKKVALAVTWGGQLGVTLAEGCEDIADVGFSTFKTAWNVTWSFGITSKSAVKKEAEKLLMYLTSKDVDRAVGDYAGSPVRISTYEEDRSKNPWYDSHLVMLEQYARPLPSLINMGAMMAPLHKYIHQALTGTITPEKALAEAQAEIEILLQP
ncbi:MAG: ABC transporter substrate-binding protein [Anaerovoracaceae bacterium]